MTNRSLLASSLVALLLAALSGCASSSSAAAAKDLMLKSPGGEVALHVKFDGPRPTYGVTRGGTTVIESSPLQMTVDGAEVTANVAAAKVDRYDVDEKFAWQGKHSEAHAHGNGAKI